jgi:nicotinamidase/pyrazinamidase
MGAKQEHNTALIVVDIQNDFLPEGALGVPHADEILPVINFLLSLPFDFRIATQDWHPLNHCSFASTWQKDAGEEILLGTYRQVLWPDHCLQGTFGAAFSKDLDTSLFDLVVHKGTDVTVDSYSTFFDNQKMKGTGLEDFLRKNQVCDLFFAGLTTEYCVFYSVVDALELGFCPYVVIDACRGVELAAGNVEQAIQEMKQRNAQFVISKEVVKMLAKRRANV